MKTKVVAKEDYIAQRILYLKLNYKKKYIYELYFNLKNTLITAKASFFFVI